MCAFSLGVFWGWGWGVEVFGYLGGEGVKLGCFFLVVRENHGKVVD